MPRRSHKKSRRGCQECKRRHLKCDETRPKCVNCVTAHLTCPYQSERGNTSPSISEDFGTATTSSTGSPLHSSPSAPSYPSSPSQIQNGRSAPLNMLHLELLHHWSTRLRQSFPLGQDVREAYVDTFVRQGLSHAFLMRQLLATSALSLSIEHPAKRLDYHQHANQLQSEALAEFNATLRALDQDNIIAAFLASSLIGFHVFCETFTYRGPSFNDTLDSFIGCINLLRGVRSLIGGWWQYLLSSELSPVLHSAHDARCASESQSRKFEELTRLIDNADVGMATREAYQETLKELELLYTYQDQSQQSEASGSANMIFSWLVIVPKTYVDLLSARRPEALIMLAYYATLLHRKKELWAIGDAGEYLITAIADHLGKHWEADLLWPKSVLNG